MKCVSRWMHSCFFPEYELFRFQVPCTHRIITVIWLRDPLPWFLVPVALISVVAWGKPAYNIVCFLRELSTWVTNVCTLWTSSWQNSNGFWWLLPVRTVNGSTDILNVRFDYQRSKSSANLKKFRRLAFFTTSIPMFSGELRASSVWHQLFPCSLPKYFNVFVCNVGCMVYSLTTVAESERNWLIWMQWLSYCDEKKNKATKLMSYKQTNKRAKKKFYK